jgi:hypothetical protein
VRGKPRPSRDAGPAIESVDRAAKKWLGSLHFVSFHDMPDNLLVPDSDVTSAIGIALGLITRCRCVLYL